MYLDVDLPVSSSPGGLGFLTKTECQMLLDEDLSVNWRI